MAVPPAVRLGRTKAFNLSGKAPPGRLHLSTSTSATPLKFNPADPNHQFWSNICQPSLKALFKYSKAYTAEDEESHLAWFRDTAVPHLGPRPSPTSPLSSMLNWDGSPYRPQWNFCGDSSTVRIGFDPTVPRTNTSPFEPDYLGGPAGVMSYFAASSNNSETDMSWANQLVSSLSPTAQEAQSLTKVWDHAKVLPPQNFLAWGCKTGGKREFKPYFFPWHKTLATGETDDEIVYFAAHDVASLPGSEDLQPVLKMLRQYTSSRADILTPNMIGIDCVAADKARLKIYALVQTNAFNFMKDAMTLGGRVSTGEAERGVECLKGIYHLMMGERTADRIDHGISKQPVHEAIWPRMSIVSWEMKVGRDVPEVKLYLPLWHFANTEGEVVENVKEMFRRFGWNEQARIYGEALKEAFPHVDFNKRAGTHGWMSFSYSDKKGPYATMYLVPRAQEAYGLQEGIINETGKKQEFAWHPASEGHWTYRDFAG
ncbi:tryptophan dimethylallyltransferase-domain-containing protein [Cladorrhinum sp. PSN332]|nr:tryptophan dimethylallyltransferase-domain-containing protein [Cladorrhinum sp. PSN332]